MAMQTRYLARQLHIHHQVVLFFYTYMMIRCSWTYSGQSCMASGSKLGIGCDSHLLCMKHHELAAAIHIVYICSIANKGLGSNPIWYFFHVLSIPFCLFIISLFFLFLWCAIYLLVKKEQREKRSDLIRPQLIIWCLGPVKKQWERDRKRW